MIMMLNFKYTRKYVGIVAVICTDTVLCVINCDTVWVNILQVFSF